MVALTSVDASGCPLGRLASELADSDPAARAALTVGFARWQDRLAVGLESMRTHGALAPEVDPQALALGLLAAVQGGLLLAQATGTATPLRLALDLALDSVEAKAAATGALPRVQA